MNTNYPIGDFITRIKNAAMMRNEEVAVRKTKFIEQVAKLLVKLGYLVDVISEKDMIKVRIRYVKKEPLFTDIKLISKPGLRIYITADEIEKHKSHTIYLISTPKGVMSSKDALKKKIGGEVIAEIY